MFIFFICTLRNGSSISAEGDAIVGRFVGEYVFYNILVMMIRFSMLLVLVLKMTSVGIFFVILLWRLQHLRHVINVVDV